MKRIFEKPGTMYGYWKVVDNTELRDKKGNLFVKCQCTSCGEIYNVRAFSLRNGRSKQCKRCAALMNMGR